MSSGLASAIKTARENAPYLAELLEQFPDIAQSLQTSEPQAVFEHALSKISARNSDEDLEILMQHLRVEKRRLHLIIALMDLSGIWEWQQVCRALTRLADEAVQTALGFAAREAGMGSDPNNPVSGLFVLAVGKYGAFELNYSSDIDIIIFYDPEHLKLPHGKPPEKTLIRLVQKMVKCLDYVDADGYVFRTDLRLRPDPRSNSVAISTLTAERYYETLGQNWERAAMIKARICAGDVEAGQNFIETVLTPYIWRRNLDYAAIDDIQAMKRQILAVGEHGDIRAGGHHLKLGLGGIREIEFYAQTQQLILGGRHPQLRSNRTDEALTSLAERGYIPKAVAEALIRDYGKLRDLEHRVQMMEDAQSHITPIHDDARSALATLAGFKSLPEFDSELVAILMRVHQAYSALFPEKESLALEAGNLVFTGVEPDPATLQTFTDLGFTRQVEVWTLMAQWLGGRTPATAMERAREILTRLAPSIIKMCSDTGMADTAFFRFADFFTRLRSGVTLLSLFESQPELLSTVIELMAQAPRLAEVLSHQPATIDAMVEPNFYALSEDEIKARYPQLISLGDDLETSMNIMRQNVREDHFRLSAAILKSRSDARVSGEIFSSIAGQCVQNLCPVVERDVQRRLEDPGGAYAIIALGKMGGREMSLTSDLDLMVIYDPKTGEPFKAHKYYTKITQRLITALSAATEEGELFEVDMALRPSGSSGPITVSLDAFDSYYKDQAWTWEFMALTRARIVYSSDTDFEHVLNERVFKQLTRKRVEADIVKDVRDMRIRLERDKAPRSHWDMKRVSGGLLDIEFIVQHLQLVHGISESKILKTSSYQALHALHEAKYLSGEDFKVLKEALIFYTETLQYLAISFTGIFEMDTANSIITQHICNIANMRTPAKLTSYYDDMRKNVRVIFDRLVA